MRFYQLFIHFIGLIGLLLGSQMLFAEQFYLFKDNRGQMLMQDSIPAEYVKNGYKVVNEHGMVVEVVLSEKEQRKQLNQRMRKQEAASRLQQQNAEKQEEDDRLIQSFSSSEEIRVAGNKKIMVIQKQIDTTIKHIDAFQSNLDRLEEQRNAGGAVDQKGMDRIRESIKQNSAFIKRKRQEQDKIKSEYIEYIKRYEMLTSG